MTPPRIGPSTPAIATSTPMKAEMKGSIFRELISGSMTRVMAYRPAPAMPERARKAINDCRDVDHPQPRDMLMKRIYETITTSLRPKTSANLVTITEKPVQVSRLPFPDGATYQGTSVCMRELAMSQHQMLDTLLQSSKLLSRQCCEL